MSYTHQELENLRDFYKNSLINDTLPFWLPRSLDKQYGGYLLMRDADGSLLDDDKSVWFLGRFASILGGLYNDFEPREEWLEAAQSGVDFLEKYAFDTDGHMFFMLTRQGAPLRKRRYFFSEAFAIAAFSQVAKATGDERLADRARALFARCMDYVDGKRALPAKFSPTRPAEGLGVPMIFLNIAQTLCDTVGCPQAEERIDQFIEAIKKCVDDTYQCVWECISPDGLPIDHFQERTITPGHAIEGAWFILQESKRRGGDKGLESLGLKMLDYSWQQGWDKEYGGIRYFSDPTGRPVMEYWQDMKFWWPQNEAVIATLMAYLISGEERYAQWHRQIHAYAHAHFADPVHGEWFGYLHRDGRISTTMKGNHFKGPYHLPRMQMVCTQMLNAYIAREVEK